MTVPTMPDEKLTPVVGDWIRFIQNNRLVIGEMKYIRKTSDAYTEYLTDCGAVSDYGDFILEIRHAS